MKIKHLLICTAAVLLAGCGKNTVQTANVISDDISETVTTAAATETQTETVTTTQPAAEKPTETSTDIPADVKILTADTLEVYEKITVGEFITEANVELTDPDALVVTDGTGELKMVIPFKYKGVNYEKEITYNVIDTEPPVLLISGNGAVVQTGKPFDLGNYVGFADNFDRNPTLSYTGEIDVNAVGNYSLTAFAADSSGNETSWDLTITVAEEVPPPYVNPDKIPFSEFIEYYGGDGISLGIDVSQWQGEIDFEAVRNAGCEFVLMRIGYYYDEFVQDPYFARNIANARDAGLKIGVYFYTTDNTADGVREHADTIAELLGGQPLDFPVAFDWEEFTGFQQYGMNTRDINELFEVFAGEMEKNGYSAMLYSSKNFLCNLWENPNNRPVWLAHYTDMTDYGGEYAIWQKDCVGQIDGIYGDVDINVWYTDMPLS